MRKPVLIICGVLVLAAAAFLLFGRSGTPGDTSPEAGFARDMAAHHAQAVDMAFTIRDKGPAKEISSLAFDIINTQANQRGMFLGWLQQWGAGPGHRPAADGLDERPRPQRRRRARPAGRPDARHGLHAGADAAQAGSGAAGRGAVPAAHDPPP
ncbi:DUF305 domain-containing protein [Nonomuraea salmonea]|uniref:DUF305 domain-containing protein n=1 Tax=Nonomuraea salmonea TaxID=46181 RepID=UPI0031F13E9B